MFKRFDHIPCFQTLAPSWAPQARSKVCVTVFEQRSHLGRPGPSDDYGGGGDDKFFVCCSEKFLSPRFSAFALMFLFGVENKLELFVECHEKRSRCIFHLTICPTTPSWNKFLNNSWNAENSKWSADYSINLIPLLECMASATNGDIMHTCIMRTKGLSYWPSVNSSIKP